MINKKGISLHPQSSNNDGAIAQLVEQRTENPCVPGSIPGGTTLNKQNPDFVLKSGFLFIITELKKRFASIRQQICLFGTCRFIRISHYNIP